MFEKRDYRMYKDIEREKVYPQICDFWARQGFYVTQLSPFQIHGTSYHQRIGLRREFFLRIDEQEKNVYIDLMFKAKITDEGMVGGVASAVLFWPVAVVGGAVSYSEYEKEANALMFNFWGYTNQLSNQTGAYPQAYTPPPPPSPPMPPYKQEKQTQDHRHAQTNEPSNQVTKQHENMEYCTECRALLPMNWKACPYCGKPKK